ncbi:MAG: hypothetical protein LBG60_00790 [Bifidobacteriaceae bacterium]|jgi:lambda repressor-like predicted transcriptional regulator|nr:hypothetical protein [Bifidobacteriaceae bacterium]
MGKTEDQRSEGNGRAAPGGGARPEPASISQEFMRKTLALREELLRPDTPANRLIDSLLRDGTMVVTPEGKVELRLGPGERRPGNSQGTDGAKPKRRRDDAELTLAIARDRRNGLTQAQIAAAQGVHVQTVRRHLSKAGIPTRRAPLSTTRLQEAKTLREAGWTLRALGERYGIAHTTVARLVEGQ